MNNPLGMMFQIMRGGGNPQQIIGQMMNNRQIVQNPMAQNAIKMFQCGDAQGLKTMAENICKERGIPVEETRKKALEMLNH